MAEHESAADEAGSWYDDAPITDEQIEGVRRSLDTPLAERGAAFAPFVVRKLLAEIDRLNTVLDANRVVRNAAESSSRTYKGAMELLKTQRTQLRAELAAENERAEKAEAERADAGDLAYRRAKLLDEALTRQAELSNGMTVAVELLDRFTAETACTEGGDTCREHGYARKPCPHPLGRQLVNAWRDVQAADATGTALSATETEDDGSPVSVDAANSSANAAGLSEAEDDRDTSAWCWTPNPHGPLRCGRLKNHPMPHRRGERTWTDKTGTER